jgi:hypothetical protein
MRSPDCNPSFVNAAPALSIFRNNGSVLEVMLRIGVCGTPAAIMTGLVDKFGLYYLQLASLYEFLTPSG